MFFSLKTTCWIFSKFMYLWSRSLFFFCKSLDFFVTIVKLHTFQHLLNHYKYEFPLCILHDRCESSQFKTHRDVRILLCNGEKRERNCRPGLNVMMPAKRVRRWTSGLCLYWLSTQCFFFRTDIGDILFWNTVRIQ